MDEVLLDLVVQVLDAERRLDLVDPRFERHHDALVLLDLVVDVALQRADDRGEAVVQLGGVGHAARDDEWRAGLVDEDRVDLVDDAVVVAALGLVEELPGHVVAEVVEAHLVVRAVRDVAPVLLPLLGRRGLVAGDDESDGEPEEAVDRAHPLRVAAGQVVVHGDEVDALAAEPVQVRGQCRHEGLALAGLHLGDPAEVQRGTAHQLDVVVPLSDRADRSLTGDGERLGGDVVEVGPVGEALSELDRLGPELVVGELLHAGLEGVDLRRHRLQCLELLTFTGAEDAIEDAHAGFECTGSPSRLVRDTITVRG